MNEQMKMLAALVGGVVVGFVMATYGSGQAVANQTQARDTERDDQVDTHNAQIKTVIEKAADKIAVMRDERDEALAELETLKPKVTNGHG